MPTLRELLEAASGGVEQSIAQTISRIAAAANQVQSGMGLGQTAAPPSVPSYIPMPTPTPQYRPTPMPIPTPPQPTATPVPQEPWRGYGPTPPSGGGLLGAIGQGYSALNKAATQGAANLTSRLGQAAEDFQNTVVIPNAYRAQLLSAGILGTEGPPGTAGMERLTAIRQAIWPPSNAGSPEELAKIQQSWAQNPAGYRMGMETLFHPASYFAGPEALARLPEAVALGPEFAGALGVKSAVEAASRVATTAGRAVETKVAEYAPTVREAAVGARGEAGGLKLPWGEETRDQYLRRTVRQGLSEKPTYVAPLPDFAETVKAVKATDNAVVRAIVGRTGINPSVLETDPIGKGLVGYYRQRLAADELANVSVTGSLDRFSQPVTGAEPFRIVDGEIKNLTVKPGQSVAWNDVFSHPADYNLAPKQQEYIRTFNQVTAETEAERIAAGLKPHPALADGGVYVPRQVQTVRGIELRRPSNPVLQRAYEEAQEGIAAGVKYDNPRSTLLLHVRSAYREIANSQLSQYLEPFSITPKELLPEKVLQQMSDATTARMAAERELRSLQNKMKRTQIGGTYTGPELAAERAAQKTLVGAREPERAALKTAIAEAKTKVADTMAEYNRAKGIYSKALLQARNAEIAKGSLFGMAEADEIPIRLWRNRFFPRDQADKLAENLGSYFQAPAGGNILSKAFELTGNEIRLSAASGDLAMPFLHGLPLAGRNPVAWAKMTLAHYTIGWADPTFYGRFARNHVETLQEMAQHGVPVGDIEFLTAAKPGGGMAVLKPLEAVPGGPAVRTGIRTVGRQTIGRLQSDFAGGLMMARTYLWESIRPSWTGTLDELGAYVRNMTGALETKALGVGPAQRGFESFWGAFSPKLLRSTIALGYDAARFLVNPADPRAQQSARSVAQLLAGIYGVYFVAGKAMGRSNDEILTGMNPLSGKKYLSYKVGNDWIGLGGQARALIQLLSRGITDPKSLVEASIQDNPILSFYNYRGAPGKTLAESLASGLTGGKVSLGGYNEPTNPLSLLGHIPESALPFVLQGVIEGQGLTANIANLLGGRTSVATLTDRKNAAVNDPSIDWGDVKRPKAGTAYKDLTPSQQGKVDAVHLEFQQEEDQNRKLAQAQIAAGIAGVNDVAFEALRQATDTYNKALIDLEPQFLTNAPQANAALRAAKEAKIQQRFNVEQTFPELAKKWDEFTAPDKSIDQWTPQDIFNQEMALYRGLGNAPTTDERDKVYQNIDGFESQLSPEQYSQLQADLGANDDPVMALRRSNLAEIESLKFNLKLPDGTVIPNVGYYDANDAIWLVVRDSNFKNDPDVNQLTYQGYKDWFVALHSKEYPAGDALQRCPVVKFVDTNATNFRQGIEKRYPAVVGILAAWGIRPNVTDEELKAVEPYRQQVMGLIQEALATTQ